MTDADPSAALSGIRERGYRNGATGAECARLSDSAAADIPVLVAALEAVLKLADNWEATAATLDGGTARANALLDCTASFRETITRELSGQETGDGY